MYIHMYVYIYTYIYIYNVYIAICSQGLASPEECSFAQTPVSPTLYCTDGFFCTDSRWILLHRHYIAQTLGINLHV